MDMAQRQPMLLALALTLTLTLTLFRTCDGHGRLVQPPARSTAWRFNFSTPIDYNDNELFCGGAAFQAQQGGRCGICGDAVTKPQPRAHENGGTYGTGVIVATYREGDIITAKVQLTAAHKGWFEFRLCPLTDLSAPATEDCLNRNILKQPNGNIRYEAGTEPNTLNIPLMLPRGVHCEQCVFQWRYRSGNSWGVDAEGQGLGHGHQEEFYGCADVRILEGVRGQEKGQEEDNGEEDQDDHDGQGEDDQGEDDQGEDDQGEDDQGEDDQGEEYHGEDDQEEDDQGEDDQGEDDQEGTEEEEEEEEEENDDESEEDRVHTIIPNVEAEGSTDVKCVATGLWKGRSRVNTWCQQNCVHVTQNCPQSICECFVLTEAKPHKPEIDIEEPDIEEPEVEEPDVEEPELKGPEPKGPELEKPDIEEPQEETMFACGFKDNVAHDDELDELCASKCDAATGTCKNSHCGCDRTCSRFVARAPYLGDESMDIFCQLQCEHGSGACPRNVCACTNVRSMSCRGRDAVLASMPEFSKFCEIVCEAGDGSKCPDECVCATS